MAAVDIAVEVTRATRKSQGHELTPFSRKTTPWTARCRRCGGTVVIRTWRSAYGLSAAGEGLDGPCPGPSTQETPS